MRTPSFNELTYLVESACSIQKQDSKLDVYGKLVYLKEKGEAVIIGDLHGDINSLELVLKDSDIEKRLRQPDQYLICLGDYIDRGPAQIQVFYRLLSLLEKYPEQVILLNGNHEGPYEFKRRGHLSVDDFANQIHHTYPNRDALLLERGFWKLYGRLYTGCVIENQALLVHGGIPVEATTLFDIAWAHRFYKTPESTYYEQILWNDPSLLRGRQHSFRGVGCMFGADIASLFLEETGLKILIRGHECYDEGYFFHDDKVLTLFSCRLPVYGNKKITYISVPLDIDFTKENLLEHLHQL